MPTAKVAIMTPPPLPSSLDMLVDKDTLAKQLEAHQTATAEGEYGLRRGLEDDRKAVMRAVTVAINREWDQKVAAAVTEYRARAASTMEGIVAGAKVYGIRR